ncbi:MAG: WxcM-like domain-containing protein [Candidatus Rokubacteria bacterium]|nr:WxcM-like domain-containing protein [Candidatus Rokubacteria bacterium]
MTDGHDRDASVAQARWREPFDVHDLTIHVDQRGMLFEILRFTDDAVPPRGQVYTFSVNPGARRGDHYHLAKREWFTCVHGRVTVLLDDRHGRTQVVALDAARPTIVYAGPGTTHALVNQGDEVSVIVSYGSEQHHPDAPDTYRAVAVTAFTPTS